MDLSNYKILVIEDSPEYQTLIRKSLGQSESHSYVGTLEEARAILKQDSQQFDLVLLDLVLPDGFGFRFFTEMKDELNIGTTPVVVLTVKGEISDKIAGLNLGVHDYITKPFDLMELNARVKNRIELVRELNQQKRISKLGNLSLDKDSYEVKIEGDSETIKFDLSPLEFKLLSYFCEQKDMVLTRETILDKIWGSGRNVLDRTVDSTIASVRKKTKHWDHNIQSIYGVGYKVTEKKIQNKTPSLTTDHKLEISHKKVMTRFHNDQELFSSVGKLFLDQVDDQILSIKNHVRAKDWSQAARIAHQLRGAMLNFSEQHNEYYENIEKQISDGQVDRKDLEVFLEHASQTAQWINNHIQKKSA